MRAVNNVQGAGSSDTYLLYKPSGTPYHTWRYGSILVASNKEKEIKITTINSPDVRYLTDISERNKHFIMSLLI